MTIGLRVQAVRAITSKTKDSIMHQTWGKNKNMSSTKCLKLEHFYVGKDSHFLLMCNLHAMFCILFHICLRVTHVLCV